MKEKLKQTVSRLLTDFRFRRFYFPDGKAAPPDQHFFFSGSSRLLILLDGAKNEPMPLNGELRTVRLQPGDCYLIPRHAWEYASFTTEQELFCLVPRGSYLRLVHYHVAGDPAIDGKWPECDWYHTSALSDSFQSVFNAFLHLKQPAETELNVAFVRLLLHLARMEMAKEIPHSGKAARTFESVLSFVENHFSEPITREDTARYLGINPGYLSQLFRSRTGGTFQDHLLKCRLEKARYMLTRTTLPVKAVAEECGWNDDVYFIRQFRKATGLSPGKYRLEHLKK